MSRSTHVLLDYTPFEATNPLTHWDRGEWPCRWICHPASLAPPFFTAYKVTFDLPNATGIRVHVSADERYELYLDGEVIGRGPERGAPDFWYYETLDLQLDAGSHVLVARVWTLGAGMAPTAQMTVAPGFLLAPEDLAYRDLLGTGHAPWEVLKLEGLSPLPGPRNYGLGDGFEIDGVLFPWGFELGEGTGWVTAKPGRVAKSGKYANLLSQTHLLFPAVLPPMLNEPRQVGRVRYASTAALDGRIFESESETSLSAMWDQLLAGDAPIEMPPHSQARVLVDLENYYCAYPQLTTGGGSGSSIRIRWAEALFYSAEKLPEGQERKGNRDEVDGKLFVGVGERFLPDGGLRRKFRPTWWRAGRYVEIVLTTAGEPLTIDDFRIYETRYPLEMESSFRFSDSRLEECVPIMLRAMQMCSHETYMDCPYYEQLMYTGDTRLEVLTHFVLQRDCRLPAKAVHLFNISLASNGLTQCRYPSNVPCFIPPFSLWWVAMVYDLALWRGEMEFVRRVMPTCRLILDTFVQRLNEEGVLDPPDGWNFMDWVPGWFWGCPPDGEVSVNSVQGWQLAGVLGLAAELEDWLGEPALAKRARTAAATLGRDLKKVFWDKSRGLFADNPSHSAWSEHAQCLAILSGQLSSEESGLLMDKMLATEDLAQTTIYFAHYYFEACQETGRMDALMKRMELWFELEENGFKTTFERPGDSRSDCHAWGAHPLFHYYATILGVRPASMGFESVKICPQLGTMDFASGRLVHPQGFIEVDFRKQDQELHARIVMPGTLEGSFVHDGTLSLLVPGENQFLVPLDGD